MILVKVNLIIEESTFKAIFITNWERCYKMGQLYCKAKRGKHYYKVGESCVLLLIGASAIVNWAGYQFQSEVIDITKWGRY